MKRVLAQLGRIEVKWIQLLDKYAFDFLRISIGLIYAVFGLLKFFPQYSPAEQLAADIRCAFGECRMYRSRYDGNPDWSGPDCQLQSQGNHLDNYLAYVLHFSAAGTAPPVCI